MGLYATTTSISLILPGFLKSNTTTSDSEGVNIFNKHITRAEAKVNSAISSRYSVEGFTSGSIPPLLTKLTEDIATYFVIRSTGYRANDRNEYLDDYKDAMETLEGLMKGNVKLTYTDGSAVAVNTTARFKSSTEDYTPIFGLDTQTSWKRDSDEIEDQADARS